MKNAVSWIRTKTKGSRLVRLIVLIWVLGIALYCALGIATIIDFLSEGITLTEYLEDEMSPTMFVGLLVGAQVLLLIGWTLIIAFIIWALDWLRKPTE